MLTVGTPVTPAANVGEFVPWQDTGTLAKIPVSRRNGIYSLAGKPPMTIDTSKNIEVTFETTAGTIRAQLFSDRAPETVNNFVALALDGFYDGIDFHRVVQDFVAQAGDPLGTGAGGPGYTFEDEVDNGLAFSKPRLLAMANAGPDTNGSQFFVTYGTPTSLNGRHTFFGELIGDFSGFENIVITADSVPGVGEIPRQNVTKTRIISVSVG